MISPELLRRYNFFSFLDDSQLIALAIIAEEVTFDRDEKIFERGEPTGAFYFLINGSVGLYYDGQECEQSVLHRGIPVGEINPGEPFSISALIEPHILTSTAWSSTPSRVLRFEAAELHKLFEKDQHLANTMTQNVAVAVLDRLHSTRVQLAAAWA